MNKHCDCFDELVVKELKSSYLLCLEWDDIETAGAILTVLRYFMVYEDFKDFLEELKDAGYSTKSCY